jgi:hypothetical protein
VIVFAATPGQRQLLVEYLSRRMASVPKDLIGNLSFEVAAVLRNGAMKGAVLYTDYRGIDVELKVAGEPGWLTQRTIREAVGYPFACLGVKRVSLQVARKNKKARRLAERLGFHLEGVKRGAAPNGGDIILYGLTQGDWVNGPLFKR